MAHRARSSSTTSSGSRRSSRRRWPKSLELSVRVESDTENPEKLSRFRAFVNRDAPDPASCSFPSVSSTARLPHEKRALLDAWSRHRARHRPSREIGGDAMSVAGNWRTLVPSRGEPRWLDVCAVDDIVPDCGPRVADASRLPGPIRRRYDVYACRTTIPSARRSSSRGASWGSRRSPQDRVADLQAKLRPAHGRLPRRSVGGPAELSVRVRHGRVEGAVSP